MSRRPAPLGWYSGSSTISFTSKPVSHPVHERADGSAPVVPRDVGMQVTPEALDLVVVWAVRRQEVKLKDVAILGESALSLLALVNDVVVEDEVDAPGLGIRSAKPREEGNEAVRVLAQAGCPDEVAAVYG